MAVYPGAIPDIPVSGWTHDQVANEIEAIAGELGVDPSGTSATVADRLALDRTLALRPRLRAGKWYATSYTHQTTNSAPTGSLRASPFATATQQTYDRIAIEVTTAAAAGGTFRMGIYNDDGAGYPGALVLDAGTVPTDTVGVKEVIISQALSPGLYWLAGVAQVAESTLRAPNQQSFYMHVSPPSAGLQYNMGWFANNVADAALPTPFPGTGSDSTRTGNSYKIMVRVA